MNITAQEPDYFCATLAVVAGDGSAAEMEIWGSVTDDSNHVTLSVSAVRTFYVQVSMLPSNALEFAEALDQATGLHEVAAVEDFDEDPASMRLSFDDTGCDLLFVLPDGNQRVAFDFDEARFIATAVRRSVAALEESP